MDNPLSGLLILVAFFIADWEVAIGTILGGSVATLSEMVIIFNDYGVRYAIMNYIKLVYIWAKNNISINIRVIQNDKNLYMSI